MARYFFHLLECGAVLLDEEGQELPDSSSIRRVALREARSVMSNEVLAGRLCLSCHIEVFDEEQRLMVVVPFKEALEVSGL